MGFSRDALLKIKDEIQTDPAVRGYAGKTSAEISSLLNELIPQNPKIYSNIQVNPHNIVLILIRRGKWEACLNAANNTLAVGHTDAIKLVESMKLHSLNIDLNDVNIKTIVDNLVTAGILDTADIMALRDVSRTELLQSRAQILQVGFVSEGDIVASLATI